MSENDPFELFVTHVLTQSCVWTRGALNLKPKSQMVGQM